jgi:hypothetical protein
MHSMVLAPGDVWDVSEGPRCLYGTMSNAASDEAGGVECGRWVTAATARSERWIVVVQIKFGVLAEVGVEAINLMTVTSLEEVQELVNEVVDLHGDFVTEPGQRDFARGRAVESDRFR